MGHFGGGRFACAWLLFRLPRAVLNYFGQGALLLRIPAASTTRSISWCRTGALSHGGLASAAAVIASQAVISGAFSMTRQAVQLGFLPRLEVRHTSERRSARSTCRGSICFLLSRCFALVLGFRSSDNLGAAYGIAVTGTMALDTCWRWSICSGVAGTGTPSSRWLLFGLSSPSTWRFSPAILKIREGGWLPLACDHRLQHHHVHGCAAARRCCENARATLCRSRPSSTLEAGAAASCARHRLFMIGNFACVPDALLHNLKHNKVLHERVVLMKVRPRTSRMSGTSTAWRSTI